MKIIIRPSNEFDLDRVTSLWSSATYRGLNKLTPRAVHHEYTDRWILRLLETNARILIAESEDDPGFIQGFICFSMIGDKLIIHFVFVDKRIREQGLAKLLLEKAGYTNPYIPMVVTSVCPQMEKVRKRYQKKGDKMKWRFLYLPEIAEELLKIYLGEHTI